MKRIRFILLVLSVIIFSGVIANPTSAEVNKKVSVETKKNLTVVQITEKAISLHEVSTNGKIIKTMYSSPISKSLGDPWYFYNNMIYFSSLTQLSIYDVNNKKTIKIPNSKNCYPCGFFKSKPYILYCNYYEEGKEQKVYIYDYKTNKIVNTFDGYSPKIAAYDDTLYYMKIEKKTTDESFQADILIYSYSIGDKKATKRDTVGIDDEYTYDVTEISAQSKDFYTYRIYDEHEYRYYYTNKGEPSEFYAGGQGHAINQVNKEQYDLVFSEDKKTAAFAERNWNELTYIAYVDMVTKKRVDTKNFGSFPYIINSKVYFVSDPSFVNSKDENSEFRQIESYAIYEYDPKTNKTKNIISLSGKIGIISMK